MTSHFLESPGKPTTMPGSRQPSALATPVLVLLAPAIDQDLTLLPTGLILKQARSSN